jgi:hypothetical protein
MPYFGPGSEPTTADHCYVSSVMFAEKVFSYWSFDAFVVVAHFVLLPIAAILLLCGYAGAIKDEIARYFAWLRHGSGGSADASSSSSSTDADDPKRP